MADFLALLMVLAIFVVALGGLRWLAARARRCGGGYSLMGPFDEMWHPSGLRARLEIHVQDERPAPAPLPGDRMI